MIGKLLPILLALIGLGGGIGAGIALRPPPQPVVMENPCGEDPHAEEPHGEDPHDDEAAEDIRFDYVKLNNQFVVPVVEGARVEALVVLSLTLQVESGQSETIYQLEPKLRDMFLQVLFDHANAGGFNGAFTKTTRMNSLRMALREAAQKVLGSKLSDVLIVDVVRQDA